MRYGQELIEALNAEIKILQAAIDRRAERIKNWETDEDDCFISQRVEERGIALAKSKIALIEAGGLSWFEEYVTTDGRPVNAKWCNTRYGEKLRVEMPDGKVVWTAATTDKGLAKVGIRKVSALRPAWFAYSSPYAGMMGAYCGDYVLFPSAYNYATGQPADILPVAYADVRE